MKMLITMIFLLVCCISLLFHLMLPTFFSLYNLREETIQIERVYTYSSASRVSSSNCKLTIESDEMSFYTWYRDGSFYRAEHNLVHDYKNGVCGSVTVLYSTSQSLLDTLFDAKKVVEIRNGNIVYYSVEQETEALIRNKNGLFMVVPFVILGFVGLSAPILISYKVIVFK